MEVHFTREQEAQLAQIATKEGADAERPVKNAALRLIANPPQNAKRARGEALRFNEAFWRGG